MAKEFDENRWFNLTLRGLLNEIEKCCTSKKEVTEDLLASIHTLFPIHSITALDLIDHRSVSLLTSPSGRKIYSCLGSLGTPYLICYTGFTCTCPSFRHNFNIENLWCKHLLALQLSLAMGVVQVKEVSEEIMMTMLNELVMCHE
ncbi:zinc finger SWIM domain-containing protein 7-like isoform X1 [Daphnia pulex]|uniref:zinc finger SWIM domain-containing protein 7-like n=1 Tax=Daphnia pulicaria TaxID=35523 RepID=UPI001EDD411A|nr:zinc finger SWIM domain-containing protein 7-like isoform X1 [Daphnia pulex]XP_046635402.1 zinc finger SWIM domain-containing protein 7-like [Daphnia pulicaria]